MLHISLRKGRIREACLGLLITMARLHATNDLQIDVLLSFFGNVVMQIVVLYFS